MNQRILEEIFFLKSYGQVGIGDAIGSLREKD